jgi:hypothetical protein
MEDRVQESNMISLRFARDSFGWHTLKDAQDEKKALTNLPVRESNPALVRIKCELYQLQVRAPLPIYWQGV